MKYIKLFESKTLNLRDEFLSTIDIIDDSYADISFHENNTFVNFHEEYLNILKFEDLKEAELFYIHKSELIEDIRHVCERLESDGYHIDLSYRNNSIEIDVLYEKVDDTIQTWFIPNFVTSTSIPSGTINYYIDKFTIDVNKLKAWFSNKGKCNVVNVFGQSHHPRKVGSVVHINTDGIDDVGDFKNELEEYIFVDKNGNKYTPGNKFGAANYKGASITVTYEYYNIKIDCNKEIYLDK